MEENGKGRSYGPLRSESEPEASGRATDASNIDGKPLGNAAHSKILLKPKREERTRLIAQPAVENGRWLGSPFLVAVEAAVSSLPIHIHLTWTCFLFLSSRQCSHWVTGLPFFLISYSGRSVCLHAEERCPLMHVSLEIRY